MHLVSLPSSNCFLKFVDLYFMFIGVSPACMCEGVGLPGTGVTNSCELPCRAGN